MNMDNMFRLKIMLAGKIDEQSMYIASEMMENKDPEKAFMAVATIKFFDKITVLLLSIFLGAMGFDRFYIGDKKLGTLKLVAFISSFLLTIIPSFMLIGLAVQSVPSESVIASYTIATLIGGLIMIAHSIMSLVDLFLCYKKSQELNSKNLFDALNSVEDINY